MKKLILILFVFFASAFIWGQSSDANVFKPHVFLGLATSQVGGDTFVGFNKLGLYGGLGIKTKFSDKIGLGMDLSFVQKGSRKGINPKIHDYSFYNLSLNYVEVPVYVTYYQEHFNFDAGISVAYLLSSTEETEGGFIFEEDFFPFNTIDLSFMFGFDYEFSDHWKFQTRFSNSIIPFRDFEGNPIGPIKAGQYHSILLFTIIRLLAQ